MKYYSLIAALALASATTLSAVDAAPKSVEARLSELENELARYKQVSEKQETKVSEIGETVDALEDRSWRSKLYISPEMRVRADSVRYNNDHIELDDGVHSGLDPVDVANQSNFSKNFDPAISARFRLNLKYEYDADTQFVGRIGVHRNSMTGQRIFALHKDMDTSPNQNTAWEVDKAYFDHRLLKGRVPLTLTAGFLPTAGGVPSNMAENKPQQSVFPSIIFDMHTYGVIGTLNLSNVLSPNTYLRMVLAKAYTQNKDSFYFQDNRLIVKNGDVAGLFLETQIPGLGENMLMIGVNRIGNIKGTPPLGDPSLIDSDHPENMGNITNYAATLSLNNIAESSLSAFVSAGYSVPDPSGKIAKYGNDDIGHDGVAYAHGPMFGENGYAFHVGGQYAFSTGTKIGAEYNHGSESWFAGTQGSEDPFNKLAVRGNVYEAYVIQSLHKTTFIKAGLLQMDEAFTGSGWHFDEPHKKKASLTSAYMLINTQF